MHKCILDGFSTEYKNTLVGVLRTQITFVTHSSPSCSVTLRTQVIRLNSGNLSPQKNDSGVFIIISLYHATKNGVISPPWTWGPFHKSLYEHFLLYEFVAPVLVYGSTEFVALTNLCETGPWFVLQHHIYSYM